MKRLFYSILLMYLLFPIKVLAEGYFNISPNSLTTEQGSSKTFTITAYNAIGDVYIKSSNSNVASVNNSEWGTGIVDEKQTKKGTITVTGKNIGTTTITLSIDGATFDGDDLAGQTKSIAVNVVAKPINPTDNLSKNNNLKSLAVEGYELLKKDNNNYSLTVTNDVNRINLTAIAEDEKSKISGIGYHNLQIGENIIEVIVISESGLQNKINITINRKNGYYLEDLEIILKKENLSDVDIIIPHDSKITKDQLSKIKESKKNIRLNYFDDNKKLIYSWVINGEEVKSIVDFTTTLSFKPDNIKEMSELSNYADGIYVNFKHSGNMPEGTKLKLYVGDKFENGDMVKLFSYNKANKSLDFTNYQVKVTDGYIEFEIDDGLLYFITMSNIASLSTVKSSSINIFVIFSLLELMIIIILVAYIYIKIKKTKTENLDIETRIPLEEQFTKVYSNQNLGSNAEHSDIYAKEPIKNSANSIQNFNK